MDSELPDLDTILTHSNTVKFACCLSDQPELMIKVICDRLVEQTQFCFENYYACHQGIYPSRSPRGHELLHEILDDAPQITTGKITDETPKVFITSETNVEGRSRTLPYIMFSESKRSVRNLILAAQPPNEDHTNIDTHPERLVWKLITKTEHLKEVAVSEWLKSMRYYSSIWLVVKEGMSLRIRKRTTADGTKVFSDLYLLWTTRTEFSEHLGIYMELEKLYKVVLDIVSLRFLRIQSGEKEEQCFINLLQLIKTCKSLHIEHCTFPECVWKNIAQQIQNSKDLEYLGIFQSWTTGRCTLPSEGMENLISNIHHCHRLVTLNFIGNTLTGILQKFLKCSSDEKFSSLETLLLNHTKLNRCDVTGLFSAIASNTFPKLKTLRLLGNDLTDCISVLQECCELPPLEILDLTVTELSRKDIKALSELADQGRLPKLKTLRLAVNPLIDMLADLFGPPDHPGFTVFEDLDISCIHLTPYDVSALANAVRNNKLPALKVLRINDEYLCNVDKEMRDLAQSCMTRYKHIPFKLDYWGF